MSLKMGSVGEDVRDLQNALNKLALPTQKQLVPDARFGPKTDARVREFQGAQFLTVDGAVGQLTQAAIAAALALLDIKPPTARKLVKRMDATPNWQTFSAPKQKLTFPHQAGFFFRLQFPGASIRPVSTFAYECDPKLQTKHIGIAIPQNCTMPKAYLIWYHHDSLKGDLLLKGIGDILLGRFDVVGQLAQTGKDVVIIVPEPKPGPHIAGVLSSDETLIQQAIQEIDQDITGISRPMPPLLLAGYSSSIRELVRFYEHCPNLRGKVKAVYDFDGILLTEFRGVNFHDWATNYPTQVFRYTGVAGPAPTKKELSGVNDIGITEADMFVFRNASRVPSIIALPIQRFRNHVDSKLAIFNTNPAQWLHTFIPTCMLAHGLSVTSGI